MRSFWNSMFPVNVALLLLLHWLSVTSAQEFKRDLPPVPCQTPDINETYYGDLVTPQCTNFTKVNGFDPHCLPKTLRNYTFLSGRGKGKEPQVYNTWMFAETCGLRMTAWRAINQLPRRTVIFKAAEAVLENWGTYAGGLILGVLTMNVFYVSTRGARCWGIFQDRPCWGINYKKAVAMLEILFLVPIALMVLVACAYQFIHLEVGRRDALAALMTPVCYSNKIQDFAPFPQCKEVLRLDWVCNESMMKVMLLGVFAIMDLFTVLLVSVFTCYYCLASITRICCCCCGGQYWWACYRRPECICGPHFNCGTCMGWLLCHGMAKTCCCCFIPVVLTLYFIAGMFGSLLVYGLLLLIFGGLTFCISWLLKVCISFASFGKCSILPIPSYWLEYTTALSLHPSSFVQSFGHDEHYEKQKVMAEMYDENHNDFTEWDIDEPGYESRIMGTPCPQVTMLAMPMLILIISVPIVVVIGVAGYSFILQDWLMETLSWAESDMRWYYTSSRMGPWNKMWVYYWQVFLELAMGLTDAFGEIFQAWWWVVKSPFTGDSVFWNQAMSFLEHGSNPANLFQTEYFFKFRQGVIFWRFLLAFVFAVARSTAMINMPFERFMDMRNQGPQFEELRNWDSPAYQMPEDPYNPYGTSQRGIYY